MADGRLEVEGEIDVDQFWPAGTSDADTTKIKVKTTGTSFKFRPHIGAPFKVTNAFSKATVHGKTTKPAIDSKGFITVRLQGIDAPELHYQPSAALKTSEQSKKQHEAYLKWNFEYRQPLAESATVAGATFLKRGGATKLKCTVISFVDSPNDVLDTPTGRFCFGRKNSCSRTHHRNSSARLVDR
jgi:endonuclease YncB( thermonuclease family)